MKKNKIILGGLLIATLFSSCSKDDFKKKNEDPSKVDPSVLYLFTEALVVADPQEYTQWFYNNSQYYLPYNQSITVSQTEGNSNLTSNVAEICYQYSQIIRTKSNYEEAKLKISKMGASEAAAYAQLMKMFEVINVYMSVYGTDSYGSQPYTEVGSAISDPTKLTPAYQTQEELFTIWLSELDSAIEVLTNDVLLDGTKITQYPIGNQDFVYSGNVTKWAKFANSLKLKIAVRLLNVDKSRAIKIAEEVVNSSVGVMDGLTDDFIWNPASTGKRAYHFDNDIDFGGGSKQLIDFLVKNQDPRVRSIFKKNKYSAAVTAQFIKEGKDIPSYIKQYVNYTSDGQFDSWKSPGEPWVRYHGVPVEVDAKSNAAYTFDYFSNDSYKLKNTDGSDFSYIPFSIYNQEMIRGQAKYTYPTLPNDATVKDEANQPYYTCYMSTAEVNLYLAEFKLLGANLPGTADSYYQKGIDYSVELIDELAKKNNIPYYAESITGVYNASSNESIALKSGEIASLLTQSDYQLTGSTADQLEKVYLQQYIHFLYMPNEQFVTVRRSGVPKTNSTIYPRQSFNASVTVPRRLWVEAISNSDPMASIRQVAFDAEGFTPGTTGGNQSLATQRVWYDKSAPEYGAGPNM